MPDSQRPSRYLRRGALALACCGLLLQGCGETVTQIDLSDVVEVLVSVDSVAVGVGRSLQLRAFPLDASGALLVGQAATWRSTDASIASVDDAGLVTGQALGAAWIVAAVGSFSDSTHVTVQVPPTLSLSEDSLGFQASAGGSDPAPQSIDVTNAGVLPLTGMAVDSIVYGAGASGWLAAQLSSASAPATLDVTATTSGITTAGLYTASVWLSATDAEGSPAEVEVTLAIAAGTAASLTINDGDGQTATVSTPVTIAPSVLLEDAFGNPVVGASVAFAVTGGGGSLAGAPATTDASGIARVGSWTLGTTAGANQVTASFSVLAPVVFSATGLAGAPTQVVVTGGNNQSAVAGNAVAVPPSVTVRDTYGNGVAGVAVTFSVASGGGSVTGATQTSDANGVATVGSWTLGTTAGANTLSVAAAGVASPATVTATGLSGAAVAIQLEAGNAQTDTVAATLPVAYAVKVVDVNGNGVSGVPVSWAVTGGGGSIPSPTSTNAQGIATAVRVLGTATGTHTATAAVGGLTGSPVQFAATATVGTAHQILINAGNSQTDTVRAVLAVAPQVRVTDRFNNPIQGHAVTFSITGSNGIVSPTTPVTTAANGTATATSWQLGTTAGASNNTLRATASGPLAGTFVTFTASATAGAPASITVVTGNNQTAITGNAVATPPTVLVRDQFNNPVASRTVNFSASGSGSVGSGSVLTNASGQASTSWTLDVTGHTMGTNGTYQNTLTASTSGVTAAQLTGFARYSFPTHVNPIFTACTGCHGGLGGLFLTGTAAQNHAALVDVTSNCSGLPRVSSAGGTTAANGSTLLLYLTPGASPPCGFNHIEFSATDSRLITFQAWIRNGAPSN